ncbi:MAG: hypothetical protein JXA78_08285 [Anaerolineales bacterium]|nr:hypothetical protein [Anaerolineales bacterium]
MKGHPGIFPGVVALFLLLSLLIAPAQAQAPQPPEPRLPAAESAPGAASAAPPLGAVLDQGDQGGAVTPGEDWQVYYHAATGKARFLTTRSGRPIQQPGLLPAGSTPEAAARNFLGVYGEMFGLRDAAQELKLLKERTLEQEAGYTTRRHYLRFQQLHQGIPILGGELIVQMDADLNVVSVSGELLPDLALGAEPFVGAESARQKALQVVAEEYGLTPDDLQTTAPELWIYNPLLLGAPGLREDSLVWRVEITSRELLPIRELALVDAGRGLVSLHFNQADSAKDRAVYDNENDASYGLPGNGPLREEGDLATGVNDVDNIYDYAGFTHDFYSSRYGRDSLDGKGMKLVSTARYCPSVASCPYNNAFWNGT